jgi:hypothetical protein
MLGSPRQRAPLAQLAEQRTLNPRVRGSSPWRRTRHTASDLGVSHFAEAPFVVLGPGWGWGGSVCRDCVGRCRLPLRRGARLWRRPAADRSRLHDALRRDQHRAPVPETEPTPAVPPAEVPRPAAVPCPPVPSLAAVSPGAQPLPIVARPEPVPRAAPVPATTPPPPRAHRPPAAHHQYRHLRAPRRTGPAADRHRRGPDRYRHRRHPAASATPTAAASAAPHSPHRNPHQPDHWSGTPDGPPAPAPRAVGASSGQRGPPVRSDDVCPE